MLLLVKLRKLFFDVFISVYKEFEDSNLLKSINIYVNNCHICHITWKLRWIHFIWLPCDQKLK